MRTRQCAGNRLSGRAYTFIPRSKQDSLCLSQETATTEKPLNFPNREFESVDEMNSWVMEFSQGRGLDGKSLYAQCGSNCSPRYTFYISSVASGLRVQAEVICGLARDRASDEYDVSTALRARCNAPPIDAPRRHRKRFRQHRPPCQTLSIENV